MNRTGRDKYMCTCKKVLSFLFKSNPVLWVADTCAKIHDKSKKKKEEAWVSNVKLLKSP